MTTANDPIRNIQSRIDELEQTISEKGEQIRERTRQLKEDMEEELSPMEIIRKHPVEVTGISFVTGIVAGRMIRGIFSRKPHPIETTVVTQQKAPLNQPSAVSAAVGAIASELLHTGRELGVTWIKNYFEAKKHKPS